MEMGYELKVTSTLLRGFAGKLLSARTRQAAKPAILESMIRSRCDCRCLMCKI